MEFQEKNILRFPDLYFEPNACWLKSGLKSVKNIQNIVQKIKNAS